MAEIAVQAVEARRTGTEIDVEALIRELEANLNVVVRPAATLINENTDHVPWLPDQRASIDWNFTRRYQRFLRELKGWALPTLQRSDDLTDRILALIENPKRQGSWDRRGMVVGEVQSGKTSNYIELICKAADSGYKFIVILTGTTNSLRAQTQLRFDEGFLGWDYTTKPCIGHKEQTRWCRNTIGRTIIQSDTFNQMPTRRVISISRSQTNSTSNWEGTRS